jgi:hypothetical protein
MSEIDIDDVDQQQITYLAEMAKKAMGSDRLLILARKEAFDDEEGEGEVMMIGGAGDWGNNSVTQIGRMMEDLIGAVMALTDNQFRVQIVTPSGAILDAAEMRKGRSADPEAEVKTRRDMDDG